VVAHPGGGPAVSARPVDEVVDTTGAGDAFAGALAAALAGGASLEDAVRAGLAAGALAITREGAH
jgi:ribokinase